MLKRCVQSRSRRGNDRLKMERASLAISGTVMEDKVITVN